MVAIPTMQSVLSSALKYYIVAIMNHCLLHIKHIIIFYIYDKVFH